MTVAPVWTAEARDEDVLAALEAENLRAAQLGRSTAFAKAFGPVGASAVMAGDDRDTPQGFAMWRSLGEDAELLTIGVLESARRGGVGARLLEAVKAAARGAGAERLLLEVDAVNAAAHALYGAAGFRRLSVRRGYYRDGADALVMEALL